MRIQRQPLTVVGSMALLSSMVGAPPAAAQGSGQGMMLEEVVVTAQRREESLQDTPIAVTAFTRQKLDNLGVLDVAEMGGFAPNVSIQKPPSSNTNMGVFIRGIGEFETSLLADPKVGVYIDGVYMSKTVGGVFDIVDMERMEVLRGPQGTLFGRNTSGGAINVTTRKPSGEWAVRAEASYGKYDYYRYGGSVDLPEIANVAAKLTAYESGNDGWADNHYSGPPVVPSFTVEEDLASDDNKAWRIALRWTPIDRVTVDYSYDKTNYSGVAAPFQVTKVKDSLYNGFNFQPTPFTFLGGDLYQQMAATVGDPDKRREDYNLDGATEQWLDVEGHALTVEWDLDVVRLKYIFGNRETVTGYHNTDLDSGAYIAPDAFYGGGAAIRKPGFHAAIDSEMEMTSHEFQIFGEAFNGRLNYTGGLFFYDEEVDEDNPQTFSLPISFVAPPGSPLVSLYQGAGFPCSGGLCLGSQRLPLPFGAPEADPNLNGLVDFIYGQESESRAVYGQATYAITDALDVTFGLRYTEDEKEAFMFNETLGHLSFADRLTADEEWDNLSGVLNLSYQVTPDARVYAKYNTGYNAGGFSARATSRAGFATPYDEEEVAAFELGLKSEWFDNRLRLNVAAFRNDYTDIQISQFEAGSGGASSRVVNAGEGTYQGLEFDITAVPIEGLTLDLTYGYLDAEFDEYMQRNPATGNLEDISDRTTVPHAPKNTAALGAQYDFPRMSYGYFSARLDVQYKDEFVFHPFNNLYDAADERTLVNARFSLNEIPMSSSADSRLRVSLWGKNLTDEEYRNWGIDFGALGFAGNTYGEPRTYGIDVVYEFN